MPVMSLRDLRRTVGQLAIVGFGGHTLPEETRALARDFDLGGVVYFAPNAPAPDKGVGTARHGPRAGRRWGSRTSAGNKDAGARRVRGQAAHGEPGQAGRLQGVLDEERSVQYGGDSGEAGDLRLRVAGAPEPAIDALQATIAMEGDRGRRDPVLRRVLLG